MLQDKYLKYGTCWIVITGLIRNQLSNIYILKQKTFDFEKKNFLAPQKTLYIVYFTSQISQVFYMLDSNQ